MFAKIIGINNTSGGIGKNIASIKLTNPKSQMARGLLANSIVQLYKDRNKCICAFGYSHELL